MLFCAALFFLLSCNKENPDLLEYNVLLDDLFHVHIAGYQTHFDYDDNKGKLNLPAKSFQGSLRFTNGGQNFAILGTGFFKILIDDEIIGYTRNGTLSLYSDDSGNFILEPQRFLWENNYKLADPVDIYMAVVKNHEEREREIIESFRVNNYGEFDNAKKNLGVGYSGEFDWAMIAKQLKVYDVPYEMLRHYRDGIYILEPHYTDEIKVSETSLVMSKRLETSNVPVIEVLSRMYFIVLNNDKIKNVAFKRELLSLALSHYAANNNEMVRGYMTALYDVLQGAGSEQNLFDTQNKMNAIYEGNRHTFIKSILPFLELDY